MSTHTTHATGRHCLLLLIFLWCLEAIGQAQTPPTQLNVEKIMQDPKWIGSSPSGLYWSPDGKYLFFNWNPGNAPADSLYYITKEDPTPRKAPYSLGQNTPSQTAAMYNSTRTAYTYSRDGDIFWVESKTGKEKRITLTIDKETDPAFSFHDTKIIYSRNNNLFAWDIATGLTEQLTNFQRTADAHAAAPSEPETERDRNATGAAAAKEGKKEPLNAQEKWLQQDQLQQFGVLRSRKEKKDLTDSLNKARKPKELRTINIDDKTLGNVHISPDGRFITYRLMRRPTGAHSTIVPSYVTESGFTQDIPGRTKVGAPQGSYSFFVFDTEKDTVIEVLPEQIPGIRDLPDYVKDYPSRNRTARKDSANSNTAPLRGVLVNGPYWSEQSAHAIVDIRSQDNKDRWLMLLDAATGKLSLLDRQRDEAWIGGPGISGFGTNTALGWINENTFWYQSEASGYSHLYTVDVSTGAKTQLTSGHYEVQQAVLSKDKKYFYISTNEVHPGEQQFYQLPVSGGKAERITTLTGANQVTVSPDDRQLAILYSYSNRPWELYLQDNKAGSRPRQITDLAMSAAFRAYPWRDPAIITFTARDGATVYARLYRASPGALSSANGSASAGAPSSNSTSGTASAANSPGAPSAASLSTGKPAVIFVHGAGYLQNAHKWWSSYFREYMFNNLLADNGYTVLDIDYRGSAGYGRDWRTGIYRHMGGKDLDDQVDGVKYLVEHEGVDAKRVGLYGGSYGGFITLMAMFTTPDVFAAGAGLRCVTDWAHYNHGYTSDILNEPYTDSLAYHRSSPIYFADGLKGHLLMCHGMVDENVHFQDIVRLTQRLIELGKNNWELAVYPVEDHGFVEPSSWTDEYKRIFKLFQTWLK